MLPILKCVRERLQYNKVVCLILYLANLLHSPVRYHISEFYLFFIFLMNGIFVIPSSSFFMFFMVFCYSFYGRLSIFPMNLSFYVLSSYLMSWTCIFLKKPLILNLRNQKLEISDIMAENVIDTAEKR